MAQKIKGITLEIGGETTGLSKALEGVNTKSRNIQKELKEVEKALKLDPSNIELLTQKQLLLGESIENSKEKLKALEKAQEDASRAMEKGIKVPEEQYRALQREISNTRQALKKLESQSDDTANALKGIGDKGEETKKLPGGFEKAIKAAGGFVAAGAAVAGVLSAIEEDTREYREDLNKLTAAYVTSGKTVEDAKDIYSAFYGILGESDRSVEAAAHLAQLTKNEEELAKWTEIAAGVTATFGDSLPIEGLTEAANETAKVGQVTGVLADALNWVGISEDTFNEKLEKTSSEQERAALITETLNGAYKEAAATYTEINASVIASREAQEKWNETMAKVGEIVAPVKAQIIEFGANLLNNVVTTISAKDESEELVKNINAEIDAYKEAKAVQEEKTQAAVAEIDYAHRLWEELQTLADENGNVTEANRVRVEYILGELSEAMGQEYKLIDNNIQGYGTLAESIENLLAVKRAEVILASQEEAWLKAKEEIKEKEAKHTELGIALMEQDLRVKEAKAALEEKYSKDAEERLAREQLRLDGMNFSYEESEKVIRSYYNDIGTYEENYEALLSGEAEKIKAINEGVSESFLKAGEATEEELKKQVVAAAIYYADVQQRVEAGVKKITQTELDEAAVQYQNACVEYEKIGKAIPEGMQVGVENGTPTLKAKIGDFVETVKSWFTGREAFDINSPSKWSEKVGAWVDEGLAIGIRENLLVVKKSFRELFEVAEDENEELLEEEKAYLAEKARIEQEEADREIQQKKDDAAKALEVAKAKAKNYEEIRKAEADYNEKIAKIDADTEKKIYKDKNKELLDNLKETADKAKEKRKEIRSHFEDMLKDAQSNIEAVTKEMQSYKAGLENTNLTEETTLTIKGGGEMDDIVIKGVRLADLSKKRQELEDFNKNILSLYELGIDETMLEQIRELGGEEGGALAQALLEASPEQRNQFIEDFKAIGKLSGEATAEIFQGEMVAAAQELHATLLELNPDLLKVGETWGSILGEGIKSKLSEAMDSLKEMLNFSVKFPGGNAVSASVTQYITATPETAYEVSEQTRRTLDDFLGWGNLS